MIDNREIFEDVEGIKWSMEDYDSPSLSSPLSDVLDWLYYDDSIELLMMWLWMWMMEMA